ncbi:MAG: DnaB-like helicase C-terminal domain-containing protein [Fusobacteriaceae bacterium]
METIIKALGKFKSVSGGNLLFDSCPFCGKSKKFYLHSEKGVYFCQSGSCNEKGGVNKLAKHLGVECKIPHTTKLSGNSNESDSKKVYTKLTLKAEDFSPLADSDGRPKKIAIDYIEYWEGRGISLETLTAMGVFINPKRHSTAYFYRRKKDTAVVCVKYRDLCLDTKKKGVSQEAGGEPILFNMQNATSNTLIITEGEPDALTLAEIGFIDKVVSVPFGASNLEWLVTCREFLESKEEIIIAADNDAAGKKMVADIVNRLPEANLKVIDLKDFKDINDFYLLNGAEELKKVIYGCTDAPIQGIDNIYDTERFDINSMNRFRTGIKALDKITRGFKESELVVVAGDNASGKTTLVKQIMLSAREEDKKSWIFNGEITPKIFKETLYLQANGRNSVKIIEDKLIPGEKDYLVTEENYDKINSWMRDKLFTFGSSETPSEKNIKNSIISAITKLNCFLLVIDNLSVINYELENGKKPFEAQGDFAVWCKETAKKYNVCILIVNHMTKSTDKMKKDKNNIKGSGIITDVADTVITITRISDEESEVDAEIDIVKNRLKGSVGTIGCGFESKLQRIFDIENETEEVAKTYSWEKIELVDYDELPF